MQTLRAIPPRLTRAHWRAVDGLSGYFLLGLAFDLAVYADGSLTPTFLAAGPLAVAFTLPFLLVSSHSLGNDRGVRDQLGALAEAVTGVGRLARALIPVVSLFLFSADDVIRVVFGIVFVSIGGLGAARVFGAVLPPSGDATETLLAVAWTGLTVVVGLALYLSWFWAIKP